jgi:lipoprotein-releasing system permease protein
LYIIGDIRQIRRLNGWENDQVGGFEIFVTDFNKLEETAEMLYDVTGPELRVRTIRQLYPQIFDWLDLHDMNVIIILSLMVLVAGITMVSTLLILILEKTNMIGTLKAMGTKNRSIRSIFLINAVYIIGQGLIWGNLLAIGLSLLQLQTGIFKLDEASYYISEVPVNMQLSHYLLINAGTLIVCTLILIVPTYIITRISPVRAIRLD